MRRMNDEKLTQFEASIERLVENVFASFFGRRLRAQDLALALARAVNDHARTAPDSDARRIAPDHFRIMLNPQVHAYLSQNDPKIGQKLSQHIVTLATQSHYRLAHIPVVEFDTDASLEKGRFRVEASHSDRSDNSTVGMQSVTVPAVETDTAVSAYLLVNSERVVNLTEAVINIGRHRQNDIILDDAFVSRHHLQLRRRAGRYVLFDVHSQTGTTVNDVQIKEHRLQSGDLIRLGRSHLIYMENQPSDDNKLPQTDPLESLD